MNLSDRNSDISRIKTAFRSQILNESAILIRRAQNKVVDEFKLNETGNLKSSLQGHFTVNDIDSGAQLSMSYLTYARFLDMGDKRRREPSVKRNGYHLYNRTIFGYLYRQTRPVLMNGFTDEVQALIRNKIVETLAGNVSDNGPMILTDFS